MRSLIVAIAAVVIAAPLTWIGGELHRENCLRTGQAGCSVAPWSGHSRKLTREQQAIQRAFHTRQQRMIQEALAAP